MISASRLTALSLATATAACSDEMLSGYVDPSAEYVLETLDDTPFTARATIRFPKAGRIAGRAPCNPYSGALDAPYPWFATKGLASTKMACAKLEAEGDYFAALGQMTLAEVSGNILILSTPQGRRMVFVAR